MPSPSISRLVSLFLSSTLLTLVLSTSGRTSESGNTAIAPSDPAQSVQEGINRYKSADYLGAISHLESALTAYQKANDRPNITIVQENLARTYQQLGQSDQALSYWQKVIPFYRHQADPTKLGRALTEQAQVYTNLGQPKTAIELLCHKLSDSHPEAYQTSSPCDPYSALSLAKTTQDPALETAALGSLGEAYRLLGKPQWAIGHLSQALDLARRQNNQLYQTSALNSRANVYASRAQLNAQRAKSAARRQDSSAAKHLENLALADDNAALRDLQDSMDLNQNDPQARLRTLLSRLSIYTRQNDPAKTADTQNQARQILGQSPENRQRIYATIDLARSLQSPTCTTAPPVDAETLLKQSVKMGQDIADRRATSFALGALGKLEECRATLMPNENAKQAALKQALILTQEAIQAADPQLKAKDSLYQWEWQTGRILKALGQTPGAIAAYQRSIKTLDEIRSDILNSNRDLQFDFRDMIDPIYRDLISLQLSLKDVNIPGDQDTQSVSIQPSAATQDLTAVLTTMDSLQLAELQNYFGSECVITAVSQVNSKESQGKLDKLSNTAIVSSIILDDQAVMILKLPNQAPKRFPIGNRIRKEQLERKVNALRSSLEDYTNKEDFNLKESQDLYDLLLRRPINALEGKSINTLVFVQDGMLRSIPMAALHDGKQFLVERYAIATTPSLTLTDLTLPKQVKWQALALGVTQATKTENTDFPALQYVESEINGLKEQLPGSQSLLDKEFREDRIQQILNQKSFPIIHIATHGQFGADPDDTFLVTGDVTKQSKLTITDLDLLLRRVSKDQAPIDLLMLTACQTAVGDDRSTLGLAGAAVRAGTRSAIASLWFVDDLSTASLVNSFYGNLPTMSKARALQKAQQKMIQQGEHPAHWAALVLVGNWL